MLRASLRETIQPKLFWFSRLVRSAVSPRFAWSVFGPQLSGQLPPARGPISAAEWPPFSGDRTSAERSGT